MSIMLNLFNVLQSFTNDYGVSIILFTIFIKVIMLPISIRSKKSLKESQLMATKVAELKKKYENRPKELNTEVSKLYKENPKSGLSIFIVLLQMPIFITLHRMFSTNIVSTTTLLTPWIPSLSMPDPFFILPVLFVLGQLLPNIAQHFKIIKTTSLPKLNFNTVGMSVFMALLLVLRMPSGLGLYFITNTLVSSLEQIFIKV